MSALAGWSTIESDAGVFTFLTEKLGVQDVQLEELVSLDSESLQALSPVYGVIFLFKFPIATTQDPSSQPTSSTSSAAHPRDGTYDDAAAANLFFAAQTIQNACGTQALLSILLNKDASSAPPSLAHPIHLGASLTDFRAFTHPLPPDVRGEALSNSEPIRTAHNAFARSTPFADETRRQAERPEDAADTYHFIAYSSIDGVLYELDGLQPAPISHGACAEHEFPEKIIPVLQRRIERYPITELRFNLMAVTRDRRIVARERGDAGMLEREEERRRAWKWEDSLRRHNFMGFAVEMLKIVARKKVEEGTYERWIEDARDKTMQRVQQTGRLGHDALD